jgi:hypothetical protein
MLPLRCSPRAQSAAEAARLIDAFGELRASLYAPAAATLAALTDGLEPALWRAPPSENATYNSPPACNATALRAAAAAAASAAQRTEALLDHAAALAAAFTGDESIAQTLLTGACAAVAAEGDDALARGGAPAQLGLPPLDCRGGVPAGAPSTGAFFGAAGGGILGVVRAAARAGVDTLQRRAEALVTSAPLESASFMLAGAATVTAPARTARNASWPCAPPLLDAPGRAWMLDAVQQQLVEPAARLVQARAHSVFARSLLQLQVVQSVTAAAMPLLAGALYYAILLRGLDKLDDLLKLVKWLAAQVQEDV